MEKFWDSEANKFTLYGALFGLLFPVIATVLEALLQFGSLSWSALLSVQRLDPLLWIIDSAPFWLGIFARFAGKRQDHLKQLLRESGHLPNPPATPTEDAGQFAGILAYFGLALVAVVLFGLGIWIQSLILTRLPATPLSTADSMAPPVRVSNPETLAAVATNTPIVLVGQRVTPVRTQPMAAVVLETTPTPTIAQQPTIVTVLQEAEVVADQQTSDRQLVATSVPTVDPTLRRVRLGYLTNNPYCTFFSQVAAIVWPQELAIAVDLQSFASSDELITALTTTEHAQAIDLTLCFIDPANRVYFHQYQSAIQVLGKVFWKADKEGLLTVANAGTAQILKRQQPCLHNFIRNQTYAGLTVADLEPITWVAAHLDEVRSWSACQQE